MFVRFVKYPGESQWAQHVEAAHQGGAEERLRPLHVPGWWFNLKLFIVLVWHFYSMCQLGVSIWNITFSLSDTFSTCNCNLPRCCSHFSYKRFFLFIVHQMFVCVVYVSICFKWFSLFWASTCQFFCHWQFTICKVREIIPFRSIVL